jgi:hypothetical protein
MDQRKAMAMAAGVTATAVAAIVAIGVNFGLFGVAAAGGKTGRLTPAATRVATLDTAPQPAEQPPAVETIVIDAPASGPATLAPDPGQPVQGPGPEVTVVNDSATATPDPAVATTASTTYEDHPDNAAPPPERAGGELDD